MPPLGAFVGVIVAGIGQVAAGIGSFISGIAGGLGFSGLGAFLSSPIGQLVLGVGLKFLTGLFTPKNDAPSIEAAKINVRLPEPDRWKAWGMCRAGGAAMYGEFDSTGAFWYVVVHADSILTERTKIYLDDIAVQLDGSNYVITDEFCLDGDNNAFVTGTSDPGGRKKFIQIWTTTHSAADPVPPQVAEFLAANPLWTTDHKLAGTTYSVIRIASISRELRYKLYRWRGPFGLGEPAVTVVGKWGICYDPNDGTQVLADRTTWKFSDDPELIWAAFRVDPYGFNMSTTDINWTKAGEQSTINKGTLLDKDGNTKTRYKCGIMIPESKSRGDGEQEILLSMSGQLVFDDDGKVWARTGIYYSPTLQLNRRRDIIGMDSVEAQGDSETQGVIIQYIDPDADYTKVSSAPWFNPLYYVPGETPKYLTIPVLSCQDHNQAMRLAKVFGYRSQPSHKILPSIGLRGLKARQERIANISYDDYVDGEYEIVTPVEVDRVGILCGTGCVPIDADRFDLLPGEEKDKPIFDNSIIGSNPILPTGVLVTYAANRINVSFDHSPREDVTYIFQYALDSSTIWNDMVTLMKDNVAYSGPVADGPSTYKIRWYALTTGNRSSGFNSPYVYISTATSVIPILWNDNAGMSWNDGQTIEWNG